MVMPARVDVAKFLICVFDRMGYRMCNRARMDGGPETLIQRFSADWLTEKPRDNRFNPKELYPKSRAYVVRAEGDKRGLDVMAWDVTAGQAPWPMTNVRNLKLPQWKALAEHPANRCLVPLTEFCEWTPDKHKVGEGAPVKGEMWFKVTDQPVMAIAGFWREIAGAGASPPPLIATSAAFTRRLALFNRHQSLLESTP